MIENIYFKQDIMIETSNRIWDPTEDQLWETYKNLRSYEKLEVWYGIVDNDCQIKRMKIVIPSGLTYLRDFNNQEDMLSQPFEVNRDFIVRFIDYFDVEGIILYVSQILCIRVLDEE